MEKFNVLCLGSQDCTPVKGNDCTHFLVNGHILVDCGPSVVRNMLDADQTFDIDTIVFTHMHLDHCIGLTSLFYYLYGMKHMDLSKLTIYGPASTLLVPVKYSIATLFCREPLESELPRLVGLSGVGEFTLPDGKDEIKVKYTPSQHATAGLCYRWEKGGVSLGMTGDTFHIPSLDTFFEGCDALIHECSAGKVPPEKYWAEELSKCACGHSSSADAAKLAETAHVKRVYLVHTAHNHADRVSQFKEVSSIPCSYLEYRDRVIL